MKRVAAVQSSYIPWKGYFDLIALADEFILLDDVQYTRRDWRNRNRIKTAQGVIWLTIPVRVKGRYHQRIDEVEISDPGWAQRHWDTLQHAYARAPCFQGMAPLFESWYARAAEFGRLVDVNRLFIEEITLLIGIETRLMSSTRYAAGGSKTERLVSLCEAAGATEYVSGPTARAYLEEEMFRARGIEVSYMDYSGYPEYPQQHGPFEHEVSVVDLLFCTGSAAADYMKQRPAVPTTDGSVPIRT